jgi:integrase
MSSETAFTKKKQRGMKPLEVIIGRKQQMILDGFYAYLKANGRGERTMFRHVYCQRRWLTYAGEDFDYETATKQQIESIVGKVRSDSKLAPATKNKILISIKLLYKWLLGDGEEYPKQVRWIKANIGKEKKITSAEILTENEVIKMIKSTKKANLRDRVIIALLWDTGMRIGELQNLRIRDIDITSDQNGVSHVTIPLEGKTGTRQVPIFMSVPYILDYLQEMGDMGRDAYLLNYYEGRWADMKMKGVLDGNAIRKMLRVTAKRAGIEKRIYPHLFRHSRATYYANRMTEQQLKSFFGWTPTSGMAGHYTHLSGRDIDSAVAKANNQEVEEKIAPALVNKVCQRCHTKNAITAIYCNVCTLPLDISQLEKVRQEQQKELARSLVLEITQNPDALKNLLGNVKLSKADKKRLLETL